MDVLEDSEVVLYGTVFELLSVTAVYVLQVYYKQRDYWPFVWCVRYISPHLASHVEQVCSNRLIRPYLNLGETAASTCTLCKLHSIAPNDNMKNKLNHVSDRELVIRIHMSYDLTLAKRVPFYSYSV